MTALNEIIDPDGDTLIIIPYTTSSSETTDASETTHSHEGRSDLSSEEHHIIHIELTCLACWYRY
jgi:hypothetical protein